MHTCMHQYTPTYTCTHTYTHACINTYRVASSAFELEMDQCVVFLGLRVNCGDGFVREWVREWVGE